MTQPRPEYPRPAFRREAWRNLNGAWDFTMDTHADVDATPPDDASYDRSIVVPFPPESVLSGIEDVGFHTSLWYRRSIDVPEEWRELDVVLHVGACDYRAVVFLDGQRVTEHVGGSAPIRADLTAWVKPGQRHELVIHAIDDVRSGRQPSGKQSRQEASHGCYYTRVTGIWQTVWLEAVHPNGLDDIHVIPDLASRRVIITPRFRSIGTGHALRITLPQQPAQEPISVSARQGIPVDVPLVEPRPWTPEDPFLHDLWLEVVDASGSTIDVVESYFGLRDVRIEGDQVLLNGEPLYQRLVLDQGYWPDGIWTAPSDEALQRDIELARAAGFNGARLHQKAFEPRFHWHADRLGWLTWAEMPSWGIDENDAVAGDNLLREWSELVTRDRNHPSIITWTPLNETEGHVVGPEHRRLVRDAARITRQLDPTRPVNDASGWVHHDTDLWTVHLYTQDPAELLELLQQSPPHRHRPDLERYEGQPLLLDEFGGTRWPPGADEQQEAWGYGEAPANEDDFFARLKGLVDAVLAADQVRGYCYTQLTDVEQEINGLFHADRTPKFDVLRLHDIFKRDPDVS